MSLFSTLSKVFTVGAGVAKAVSSISAGRESARAATANAAEAERRATEERRVTEDEALDFERRLSAVRARNRAARAGSGVTREGTPQITDRAFGDEVEFQVGKIRRGGESSAIAFEKQAEQERRFGASARRAGFFGAGTTLLTTAAEVFG